MRFECIDCHKIVGPKNGDGPDYYLCEPCAIKRLHGQER